MASDLCPTCGANRASDNPNQWCACPKTTASNAGEGETLKTASHEIAHLSRWKPDGLMMVNDYQGAYVRRDHVLQLLVKARAALASNAGERMTDEQAAALWQKYLRVSDLDGYSIHGGLELVRAVEAARQIAQTSSRVLMPFEPTDEMETAAENAYEESGGTFPDWKAAYRAMRAVALASKPPAGEQKPVAWQRYEPTVMVEESRGRLTATGAVMEPKDEGRWVRLSDVLAKVSIGWVDDGGLVFWKAGPPPDGTDLYTAPQPEQVAQDSEETKDYRWLIRGKRGQLVWNHVLGVDEIDGHDSVKDAIRAARARGEKGGAA